MASTDSKVTNETMQNGDRNISVTKTFSPDGELKSIRELTTFDGETNYKLRVTEYNPDGTVSYHHYETGQDAGYELIPERATNIDFEYRDGELVRTEATVVDTGTANTLQIERTHTEDGTSTVRTENVEIDSDPALASDLYLDMELEEKDSVVLLGTITTVTVDGVEVEKTTYVQSVMNDTEHNFTENGDRVTLHETTKVETLDDRTVTINVKEYVTEDYEKIQSCNVQIDYADGSRETIEYETNYDAYENPYNVDTISSDNSGRNYIETRYETIEIGTMRFERVDYEKTVFSNTEQLVTYDYSGDKVTCNVERRVDGVLTRTEVYDGTDLRNGIAIEVTNYDRDGNVVSHSVAERDPDATHERWVETTHYEGRTDVSVATIDVYDDFSIRTESHEDGTVEKTFIEKDGVQYECRTVDNADGTTTIRANIVNEEPYSYEHDGTEMFEATEVTTELNVTVSGESGDFIKYSETTSATKDYVDAYFKLGESHERTEITIEYVDGELVTTTTEYFEAETANDTSVYITETVESGDKKITTTIEQRQDGLGDHGSDYDVARVERVIEGDGYQTVVSYVIDVPDGYVYDRFEYLMERYQEDSPMSPDGTAEKEMVVEKYVDGKLVSRDYVHEGDNAKEIIDKDPDPDTEGIEVEDLDDDDTADY